MDIGKELRVIEAEQPSTEPLEREPSTVERPAREPMEPAPKKG